ncbi:MAG: extracellular solute-binding protein [Deltaproteobacteria bacterium]|nr:extracellular solute-binding protein [Deltaproteobacteria bacterium]
MLSKSLRARVVCSLILVFFSLGISLKALAQSMDIIEGAKKEGQVVYYTGMNLDQATVFAQEFVKKYPFIKPEIFRSSGEKVLTKYLTEARAKTYRADVFQTSVIQIFQLKEQGLLQKYVSPESSAYPDGFKDLEGHWTAFYLLPYVIGYNTNIVPRKEAPRSYEDLLNVKWKGKIGLEAEQYQWFFHLLKIMGREKGMDFMRRLATQDLQMRHGHSLLTQLVISGEIPISVVLYGNDVEDEKQRKGAPIDWVRFKGPTITAFNAISVPANPPHPNAAKLFVDFALSREGQQILQRSFRRVPARPDASQGMPSIVEGLTLYPARPEELIKNYKETVAQFKEIFRAP